MGNFYISLARGLKGGTDEQLVSTGDGSLVLDNCEIYQDGGVIKRWGSTTIDMTPFGGGDMGNVWRLSTHARSLLALQRGAVPASKWSPERQRWAPATTSVRGPYGYTRLPVGAALNLRSQDTAYLPGYAATVHLDAAGNPVVTIVGDQSQDILFKAVVATIFARPAHYARIFACAGRFTVIYDDSNQQLWAAVYDPTTVPSTPTPVNITASHTVNDGFGYIDAIAASATEIEIAYRTSDATPRIWRVRFAPLSATSVANSEITDAGGAHINPDGALAWMRDLGASGKLALITASGGSGGSVKVHWNLTGGTPSQTYTVDNGSLANTGSDHARAILQVCGCTRSNDSSGDFVVLFQVAKSSSTIDRFGGRMIAAGFRAPGGALTKARWCGELGIVSVPFAFDGQQVLVLAFDNTSDGGGTPFLSLQTSYFLCRMPDSVKDAASAGFPGDTTDGGPTPLATFIVGNGAGDSTIGGLQSQVTSVAIGAGGLPFVALRTRNSGNVAPDRGLELVTFDPAPALGHEIEVAGATMIPGASATAFDGSILSPFGFQTFPPPPVIVDVDPGIATGPLEAGKTYVYQQVWRYDDPLTGRIHRSHPSDPVAHLVGATVSVVTVEMGTYPFGDKTNVVSELYRSQGDQPELLNLDGAKSTANIQGQTFQLFGRGPDDGDLYSDAEIVDNDFIYTTGGVLPNQPIPGLTDLCLHNDRLYGASMDDRRVIFFSKVLDANNAPEFTEQGTLTMRKPVVGMASFIGAFLIFDEDAVRFIQASAGPDSRGQGTFPEPTVALSGVQTEGPHTIVVTTSGVLFRTTAPQVGWLMVGRDLGIQPAGIDVQQFSGSPITAGIFVPGKQQARFYTASGTTIVYDVIHQQWGTSSPQTAQTATIWKGVPAYYRQAVVFEGGVTLAQVYVETPNVYTEGGITYGMQISTAWYQQAVGRFGAYQNVGGNFHVQELQGIGKTIGAHTLDVAVSINYDTSRVLRRYHGTPGPLWNWRIPGVGLMSAMRVTIRETSATAGPKINGLAGRLVPKNGLRAVAGSRNLRGGVG